MNVFWFELRTTVDEINLDIWFIKTEWSLIDLNGVFYGSSFSRKFAVSIQGGVSEQNGLVL